MKVLFRMAKFQYLNNYAITMLIVLRPSTNSWGRCKTLLNIHRRSERAFLIGCFRRAAMLITLIEVVKQTMNSLHYCFLVCFKQKSP